MTRALHITRDFPPRINGGISTAVGGLARALASRGVACSVISFDAWRPNATGASADPPVRDGDVLRVTSPSQLDAAAAFAAETAPTLVHVHHAMLWDFAMKLSVPKVFSLHVAQAHMRRIRGLSDETMSEVAQRRAFAEAAVVTVPSEQARTVVDVDARVVPLGVDAPDGTAIAPDSALYVGRFGDVKGTLELLHAIPRIRQRAPDLRFVVAGGLPDNRKADARWRRRFAAEAPSAELVGWLDPPALADAYRRASFLVAPSWYETFGQVILEAMQYGAPAVATYGEGAAVRRIAPRDIGALVDAVCDLVTNPNQLEAMRKAATELAPAWRWDARIEPWLALYRELS